MGRTLKDPWNMKSVMEPHYKEQKMPPQNLTRVIYTAAGEKQRVAKARQSSGFGHR